MELVSATSRVLRDLKADQNRWMLRLQEKGVAVKETEDGLQLDGPAGDVWVVKQVLHAMGLGFPPQKAFKLFNDNFFIEVLNLKLIVRNEKSIARFKGRVIGLHGKAKATIEELSGAFLAISDEDIAVLGEYEELQAAKEAVLRLLEGATHASVFAFLEKRNREQRLSLR